MTVSSFIASFLHVCIHHLLSTLYAGPLIQYPASWTGNRNRCLLLWFSKHWPCKLLVSALPSPRSTELHPQVWGSTYGFPRILCWGALWSLCSEQRTALAGISTQQGPHLLSLGSLDIACSYRCGPAIHGFGFESWLCLLALCLEQVTFPLWATLSLSLSPYLKRGQYNLPHGVARRTEEDHVGLALNIESGMQEALTEL